MKKTIKFLIIFLFPLLVGFLYEYFFVSERNLFFGQRFSIAENTWYYIRVFTCFFSLHLGISFDILIEKFSGKRSKSLKTALKQMVRDNNWKVAVFFSPIIFYGIYVAISREPDTFYANLVAFYNGFFWKNSIEKLREKKN